jgi:hypothetical protein
MEYKIGDKIRILEMKGEPRYSGRIGIVERIDSIGQLHGSWGGLAVSPQDDRVEIVSRNHIEAKFYMNGVGIIAKSHDKKLKKIYFYDMNYNFYKSVSSKDNLEWSKCKKLFGDKEK